ncbi:MAG: hypothetical protein NXI04_12390 [Planctomycetaceae bacterium]|nr:hypothetical protein [Planctomycetaceae bacterium]
MTQVLLLTFDRLPNRQLTGDDAALTQAYETLDAVSASFENHYLQQPGVHGVLSSPAWPQLMQALQNSSANVQLLQDEASVLPLAETESTFRAVSSPEVIEAVREKPEGPTLRWVHVALSVSDDAAAARFTQLTQAVSTAKWTTALITSLTGDDAPVSMRFQSPCFESLIRVPLWLTGKDGDCRRIQAVTGSFDMAVTIAELFERMVVSEAAREPGAPADGGELRQLHGPMNLLAAAATPGQSLDRNLLIESSTARAIRSRSFLFVAPHGQTDAFRTGLYVKPADHWNVNDVSAEYLQQTQDFENLLETADA